MAARSADGLLFVCFVVLFMVCRVWILVLSSIEYFVTLQVLCILSVGETWLWKRLAGLSVLSLRREKRLNSGSAIRGVRIQPDISFVGGMDE